jgi:hypothetical protein
VVSIHEATGKGDITAIGGEKFPAYHESGKAFLYLGLVNTGKGFDLRVAPTIAVKATKESLFPGGGSFCEYAMLQDGEWDHVFIGTRQGTTVTFQPSHVALYIPSGDSYLGFECNT